MITDNCCNICGSNFLEAIFDLYQFPNVTSDCRPWSSGRSILTCEECGVMKRTVLPSAAYSFDNIYENYEMFKHSMLASDQMNFSPSNIPQGRTQKILKFIERKLPQHPSSILDMGSGSGAGLIALAKQFPFASIYGYEPNDHPQERQKNLPDNVVSIFSQRPVTKEKHDFITLFHVFEHVDDIFELLNYISSMLSAKGHLLIQVPYPLCGPFDFIIADHIWHFTKKSLVSILNKANFTTQYIGNEIIEKELTVLATPGDPVSAPVLNTNEVLQGIEGVRWLIRFKLFLDDIKNNVPEVAIYGTGPAAAWAGHILEEKVVAYIDDDPARINSIFNFKPVLSPQQIDKSMVVIAPFPDYQAQWIAEKNMDLNFLLFKK